MYRVGSLINKHGMHILFSCLILCIVLKYGVTHNVTNTPCFVLLQKRVIRLVCGTKRLDHTYLLFHNVHILKSPDLVKLKTAIIMFKAYLYLLLMNVRFVIHPGINVSSSKSMYILT